VPKSIFRPLSKWHECNKIIEIKRTQKTRDLAEQVDPQNFQSVTTHAKNISQGDIKYCADLEQHGGEAVPSRVSSPEKSLTGFKVTSLGMPQASMIEKETEDSKFDLQVYPRFLYFHKVDHDGTLAHQGCLINGKIDQGYIKKYTKNK